MLQSEHQRRAYLKALGIDVWLPRNSAESESSDAIDEPLIDETSIDAMDWAELRESVAQCTRCVLHESRTRTVFGVGNPNADWMIIGEAPGAEEDRRGEPFVGRAGKLLDEMLRAVGQARDDVFIANILKCRPPNNRDPKPVEAAACRTYLEQQIDRVQPKMILAVGKIAAQHLLGSDAPVGKMRGIVHRHGDIPLIVTYHPAYLLRSPSQKGKSWDDLCLATRVLSDSAA
jgi:uracil-DNA glycosylase family 4